jgi:hypothetical protein
LLRSLPTPPLPRHLVDFQRRGFRLDRPDRRAHLERVATSFLDGYHLARRATGLGELHDLLAAVPADFRGWAYEGAGMHAALVDTMTFGHARAVSALAAGRGDGYTHLIHIGAGWTTALARVAWLPVQPRAPLLRWLSLDGAGFGASFFGGHRVVAHLAGRARTPADRARLAGAGRALWFVETGDVPAIAETIAGLPEPAHRDLWAGIGLACAYAGPTVAGDRELLVAAAGRHRSCLAQGVAFAAAARLRAGPVPEHTAVACAELVGADVATVATWAYDACADLVDRMDVAAYDMWRRRLAARCARLEVAG